MSKRIFVNLPVDDVTKSVVAGGRRGAEPGRAARRRAGANRRSREGACTLEVRVSRDDVL